MRQIDNMTPSELETLRVKGMLAETARGSQNDAKVQVAPNEKLTHGFNGRLQIAVEPQAQHSPLPWRCEDGVILGRDPYSSEEITIADTAPGNAALTEYDQANAKLIVRSVNNAEALAEALRILNGCAERGLDQSATHDGLSNCDAIAKARAALANWEGVKQP